MVRYLFIVARNHGDLFGYLYDRFHGDEKVQVILDRRTRGRERDRLVALGDGPSHERRQRPDIDEQLRAGSHVILTLDR